MILGLQRHVESHRLEKRNAPDAGCSDHDRGFNVSFISGNATNLSAMHQKRFGFCARNINHAHLASAREEVVGHAGAITITGVRLISRSHNVINNPIGLDGL